MDDRNAFRKREARARRLAARYPESKGPLLFYARVARVQAGLDAAPGGLEGAIASVRTLANEAGPEPLRGLAARLDESGVREAMARYLSGENVWSPESFFARVLLQVGYGARAVSGSRSALATELCPDCGQPPQAGSLRRQGDGTAAGLVCSLCPRDWAIPRGRCPSCGERDETRLVYYHAPEIPHVKLSACESCRRYLHFIDVSSEPSAVPVVDEMIALSLDVWAREREYRKLFPNLLGI